MPCKYPVNYHSLSTLLPSVMDIFDTLIPEALILHICLLVLICMYYPIIMLWEGIPMQNYLCLYSELPITTFLYYNPNWADINHQKTELEILSLFTQQYMLHPPVLLYSTTSMFLSTIYIFFLVNVGLRYLEQSYLIPLG